MAVAASKYGNSGGPPTSGSDTRKTGEGFGIARACRWGESGGGEERVSSDGVAPFLNQCSGRGEEGDPTLEAPRGERGWNGCSLTAAHA
jgi:hypothetical protein